MASISTSLASSASSASSAPFLTEPEERDLTNLKRLHDNGILDETEYRASKAVILEAAKRRRLSPGELQPIATTPTIVAAIKSTTPHSATAQVPHAHAATSPLAAGYSSSIGGGGGGSGSSGSKGGGGGKAGAKKSSSGGSSGSGSSTITPVQRIDETSLAHFSRGQATEQPSGATFAKEREEILRSFSVKTQGAHCNRRGLWLLVGACTSAVRSRLRSKGILHLADVLGRDDFDAVELEVKAWTGSGGRGGRGGGGKEERGSGIKALGVAVYKANNLQGYGSGAKYLMFGSHPPEDSVTVLQQLRQGLYADSSIIIEATAGSRNKRLRRPPKKQLSGISIGDNEDDDALYMKIKRVEEEEKGEEEEEEEGPFYHPGRRGAPRWSNGKFISNKQHSAAHDLLCLRHA